MQRSSKPLVTFRPGVEPLEARDVPATVSAAIPADLINVMATWEPGHVRTAGDMGYADTLPIASGVRIGSGSHYNVTAHTSAGDAVFELDTAGPGKPWVVAAFSDASLPMLDLTPLTPPVIPINQVSIPLAQLRVLQGIAVRGDQTTVLTAADFGFDVRALAGQPTDVILQPSGQLTSGVLSVALQVPVHLDGSDAYWRIEMVSLDDGATWSLNMGQIGMSLELNAYYNTQCPNYLPSEPGVQNVLTLDTTVSAQPATAQASAPAAKKNAPAPKPPAKHGHALQALVRLPAARHR